VTFTRIAVWAGIVLFGFMCFLAAIGFTAMIAPLVTVGLLVLLIGGGNAMRGRSPYAAYGRTAPRGPTAGRAEPNGADPTTAPPSGAQPTTAPPSGAQPTTAPPSGAQPAQPTTAQPTGADPTAAPPAGPDR
jgi:hypothetical protein